MLYKIANFEAQVWYSLTIQFIPSADGIIFSTSLLFQPERLALTNPTDRPLSNFNILSAFL
jgi:hypothetical protein